MAREALELWEHGEVTVTPYIRSEGRLIARPAGNRVGADHYRARCRMRVAEGSGGLVIVEARGTTKAKATEALAGKIADRKADRHGKVTKGSTSTRPTGRMTVRVYATTHWLPSLGAMVQRGDGSIGSEGTVVRYRQVLTGQILPGMGEGGVEFGSRPLSKVTAGEIARLLAKMTPAVAKSARAALRRLFDAALLDNAVQSNPAASLPRITRARSSVRRAAGLTTDQVGVLLDALSEVERLEREGNKRRSDLAEPLAFIAGTGVRTSEALALAWRDVDLTAGTVQIVATVNANGRRVERTKTSAGHRVLTLPTAVVSMLRARKLASVAVVETPDFPALVFASAPLGRGGGREHDTPRWASNVTGQVRSAVNALVAAGKLDAEVYADFTARTLRKSMALAMDELGYGSREAADQLGHSRPSITQDVYTPRMGKGPTDLAERIAARS